MEQSKLLPAGVDARVRAAVSHYWRKLLDQRSRQSTAVADRGRRPDVTGGKQMDGFCDLVTWVLAFNGVPRESIFAESQIPGYFRPTKKWDLLVVHRGRLVAALEFKSQRGPSIGNNINNRSEEAIGVAVDFLHASRSGIFGAGASAPWVGWLMMLDAEGSTEVSRLKEPHFKALDEFQGTSYEQRYFLLLRKLCMEKYLDAAAFMMIHEKDAVSGEYREPVSDLAVRSFLASLAGHVRAQIEGVE